MTSVFHQLLQNEAFVDVTLACNDLSLKAHKVSTHQKFILRNCTTFHGEDRDGKLNTCCYFWRTVAYQAVTYCLLTQATIKNDTIFSDENLEFQVEATRQYIPIIL